MKQQADAGRSERFFEAGDWVWLKLQPYRQESVQHRSKEKLGPKYFGPFKVISKVEQVAYKLLLPKQVKIHDVFHVSQLKAFKGTLPALPHIPGWLQGADPDQHPQPKTVLERRIKKKQNKAAVQLLIEWENLPLAEASWEWYDDLIKKFPDFPL